MVSTLRPPKVTAQMYEVGNVRYLAKLALLGSRHALSISVSALYRSISMKMLTPFSSQTEKGSPFLHRFPRNP